MPKMKLHSFVYTLGEIEVGEYRNTLTKGQLAVLDKGSSITVIIQSHARLLVVAGKPLNEPVARGGPFVMNTKKEILQAFHDYKTGDF